MVSNTISSIVTASVLCSIIVSCGSHLIILETETDLLPYWTVQSSSSYLGNMSETEDENGDQVCIPPKVLPESIGFWSTCQEQRLIIEFSYDYPLNPISITVISYLEGRQYLDINAYEGPGPAGEQLIKITEQIWNSTTSNVNLGFSWTSDSSLVFETNFISDKADFVDRIQIEFPDLPTTTGPSTSTSPAETSSTSTESESLTTTEKVQETTQSEEEITEDASLPPANEISEYWLKFIIYFLTAIIVFLLFTIVAIILINSRKAKIVLDSHHQEEVRQPEWTDGSSSRRIPLPRIDWSYPQSRFY